MGQSLFHFHAEACPLWSALVSWVSLSHQLGLISFTEEAGQQLISKKKQFAEGNWFEVSLQEATKTLRAGNEAPAPDALAGEAGSMVIAVSQAFHASVEREPGGCSAVSLPMRLPGIPVSFSLSFKPPGRNSH